MELVHTLRASDFIAVLPDFFGFIACGLLVGLFAWAVAKMIDFCMSLLKY